MHSKPLKPPHQRGCLWFNMKWRAFDRTRSFHFGSRPNGYYTRSCLPMRSRQTVRRTHSTQTASQGEWYCGTNRDTPLCHSPNTHMDLPIQSGGRERRLYRLTTQRCEPKSVPLKSCFLALLHEIHRLLGIPWTARGEGTESQISFSLFAF